MKSKRQAEEEARAQLEVRRQVENICYLAVSRPWPSSHRDGVRGKVVGGFDGARAARVLGAVLVRAHAMASLDLRFNLRILAYEAGFARYEAVRDALEDLAAAGWVEFTLGTQHFYNYDTLVKKGEGSRVKLLPKPIEGSYSPKRLPPLDLDCFSDEGSGTPGWLVIARLRFKYQEQRVVELGLGELADLTGMTYERVKRSMPKMADEQLCQKDGRKYEFHQDLLENLNDPYHSSFGNHRGDERIQKNNKKAVWRERLNSLPAHRPPRGHPDGATDAFKQRMTEYIAAKGA